MILVAHGNILSYFSMDDDLWISHDNFEDKDDEYGANSAKTGSKFAYAIKKKVIRMFAYEDANYLYSIGILFQDGTFSGIVFKHYQESNDVFERIAVEGRIEGQIVSAAADREHARCLYVISVDKGQAMLWGFSKGELKKIDLEESSVRINPKSKIIPYFSPADNTQFVIMEPDENYFRIWEHFTNPEDDTFTFGFRTAKKKIYEDGMAARIDDSSLHSVVATAGEDLIILVDNQDMHVYNLIGVELDWKVRGYKVPNENVVTFKNVFMRGLHLLQD